MADPSGPRAGFGHRLGAFLVDSLLLGVVQFVLSVLLNQEVVAALSLALGLAYFTYFEGSAAGQTLGKRALGIRVYDFRAGGPIGYGRAFLRWVGRIVSTIPCLLGYLWMLWDGEKQTWHDKIAGTVVVPVSVYPVQ